MPTIRNVAFIGLNRSGKTSLVEAILHTTAAISRRGKIQDGTTTTDYEPECIQRQMSTSTSFARTTYGDTLINIIDCPGFVDFQEEAKLALMGVDAAVFVVEPDPGKLIQIEHLLRFAEEIGLARLLFVNKLDKHDIDYVQTLSALAAMTGSKAPHPLHSLQYPIMNGNGITGYVNVLTQTAYAFKGAEQTKQSSIPSDISGDVAAEHERLVDGLADTDDTVLEMVIDNKEPPINMLDKDLRAAVRSGKVVPILVGSAHTDAGVKPLLDAIVEFCPAPDEREYVDKAGKKISISANGPVIAQVMKTYVSPQSGKLSVCRVFTGTITPDTTLSDTTRGGAKERVGGLYWLQGKKQETMPAAGPGSIVAIARLETPQTGDTLTTDSKDSIEMPAPAAPPPLYCMAISPKNRNDETKLNTLLQKIMEEDPILLIDRAPETNEFCMYGQGEMHLSLNRHRLERKYHIELDSTRPKIAYKETVGTSVEAHGKHKKQTGGKGQFGEVYLRINPLDRGSGNKFSESVVGGSVPRQYIPGVEKGVHEAFTRGNVAGFPVVDVHVDLYDGSYHDVDSDEMSFRMAAILAVREGLAKAHPFILEPIAEVKVIVPSVHTAGVLSQLNGRRGHILGYGASVDRPGWDEVDAQVPQAELWDYIIELRTLTHGLGFYTWKPSHMAPIPPDISKHLQAQHQAEAASSHTH